MHERILILSSDKYNNIKATRFLAAKVTFSNKDATVCKISSLIVKSVLTLLLAAVMWVQVPQWKDDWSKCAVDVPDPSCHWYVVAPDNTFGEGFNWETAPWFDAHGLNDIAELDNAMINIQRQASTES